MTKTRKLSLWSRWLLAPKGRQPAQLPNCLAPRPPRHCLPDAFTTPQRLRCQNKPVMYDGDISWTSFEKYPWKNIDGFVKSLPECFNRFACHSQYSDYEWQLDYSGNFERECQLLQTWTYSSLLLDSSNWQLIGIGSLFLSEKANKESLRSDQNGTLYYFYSFPLLR